MWGYTAQQVATKTTEIGRREDTQRERLRQGRTPRQDKTSKRVQTDDRSKKKKLHYEMSHRITQLNNNKAAMRALFISLAALLSLELMTTVRCK